MDIVYILSVLLVYGMIGRLVFGVMDRVWGRTYESCSDDRTIASGVFWPIAIPTILIIAMVRRIINSEKTVGWLLADRFIQRRQQKLRVSTPVDILTQADLQDIDQQVEAAVQKRAS